MSVYLAVKTTRGYDVAWLSDEQIDDVVVGASVKAHLHSHLRDGPIGAALAGLQDDQQVRAFFDQFRCDVWVADLLRLGAMAGTATVFVWEGGWWMVMSRLTRRSVTLRRYLSNRLEERHVEA